MSSEVVVIEAVRSPTGRRNGVLAGMHPNDLLGLVQSEVLRRSGLDGRSVGQVVGGCVGQVGAQASNVTRNAWLTAGLPITVPAVTLDAQCGSSQQAFNMAYSAIRSGVVKSAIVCGVEVMSRVPMGAPVPTEPFVGKPINRNYWKQHEFTTQFEGAERIAEKFGITRTDCDEFGKQSQDRAGSAWSEHRFDTQILNVEAPDTGENLALLETVHVVDRDEGIRPTTMEALSGLRPTGRTDGVHTAGSSSQIADGASAVLLASDEFAIENGLTPLASVVDVCLVGCDPVLMLEGPIPATHTLLERNSMAFGDIDLVEINEAFASVVLAWQQEFDADASMVNPNGGAIAMGHPLGATGSMLVTKAVHELVRADKEMALVTMCCGGGLGTGTLLQRA